MDALPLPPRLVAAAVEEGRDGWLATLPGLVEEVAARWSLDVGPPFEPGGQAAWVAPVRTAGGVERVLKLGWRHHEAAHEADGLRFWAGEGAVRLHEVDEREDTIVLLIERCRPGDPLSTRPAEEQDAVIASLLPRLWREPPPGSRFRPLQEMCDAWTAGFRGQVTTHDGSYVPRTRDAGLVRAGMELFRSLPASADRQVVLATDLHAGNVLAAEREPWLVIDPKPYVGDPAYDLLQHLLNCPDRLHADPRGFATRMADRLGLDPDRVLLWLFARCVKEAPTWPGLDDIARRIAPS